MYNLRSRNNPHQAVLYLSTVHTARTYLVLPTIQVAAVDKPQLHMWETGVMRITRCGTAVHLLMLTRYSRLYGKLLLGVSLEILPDRPRRDLVAMLLGT